MPSKAFSRRFARGKMRQCHLVWPT